MKHLIRNIFTCLTIITLLNMGCGSGSKVKTSPEMEDFIKMFDGKFSGVSAAIEKYAAQPGMDTKDMDTKDLSQPTVTAVSDKDGKSCYTIVINDGVKDCKYSICWENKKIVSIEDMTE